MAQYDYGWRGYRETARPRRRPGRPWHLQPGSEDPRDGWGWSDRAPADDYRGDWRPANRVTARYNRDYVHPRDDGYGVNYNPYAGDARWRMDDFTAYERPYITKGGSYTYRGGRSMGWERRDDRGPGLYRRGPDRYGRDYW